VTGSVSGYRQFVSASRGIGGRKVGSLLSASPDSLAEGVMVAGGEVSGLVSGDCGDSPARELSPANR
jgi:hypothetical protein